MVIIRINKGEDSKIIIQGKVTSWKYVTDLSPGDFVVISTRERFIRSRNRSGWLSPP